MRGGDLSNEPATSVGIRFERVIKTSEGKLNRSAKAHMEHMSGSIDVNIYVYTTGDRRTAMAFLVKWGVPYRDVIGVDSDLELAEVVREMDLMTYYDIDRNVLQNINSRGTGRIDTQEWTSELTS